jgi:hypothetical protein
MATTTKTNGTKHAPAAAPPSALAATDPAAAAPVERVPPAEVAALQLAMSQLETRRERQRAREAEAREAAAEAKTLEGLIEQMKAAWTAKYKLDEGAKIDLPSGVIRRASAATGAGATS